MACLHEKKCTTKCIITSAANLARLSVVYKATFIRFFERERINVNFYSIKVRSLEQLYIYCNKLIK